MRLADIPALLLEEATRKWRRRAIAGAVILVGALVAFFETLSAARHALEPALGPAGARLVLAGVALAAIAAAAFWLSRAEKADAAERRAAVKLEGEDRISVIAEAINLGYTFARDLRKGADRPGEPAPDPEAAADPEAADADVPTRTRPRPKPAAAA